MLRFMLKRLLLMAVTLLIVISATFFLMHSIPGDPLTSMALELPQQARINFNQKYGFDKPLMEQYGMFLRQLARGDLGESLKYPGRSVVEIIGKYAPVSGTLGLWGLGIGVVIGVILGIVAAVFRGRWPDWVIVSLSILGVTIPIFVFAPLLQYLLSVRLKLLPTAGWKGVKYAVLPVGIMVINTLATYTRFMRSSVLEVTSQDYILTAEAKGITPLGVAVRHILRNAFQPILTILGPQVASVFLGSLVVEKVFSIPGLGVYYVNAINDRDYTMIMGMTIFMTALFIVSVFVTDLLYGVLDPRIRTAAKE